MLFIENISIIFLEIWAIEVEVSVGFCRNGKLKGQTKLFLKFMVQFILEVYDQNWLEIDPFRITNKKLH